MVSISPAITSAARTLANFGRRQWLVASATAAAVAAVIGIATVLIPNSVFGREIPPTWWSYPVWILTSALTGLLVATYVRTDLDTEFDIAADSGEVDPPNESDGPRRWAVVGTFLAWFAVGCPVCNKIVLLALGYSGALTWFAPVQPVLAVVAVALLVYALIRRLDAATSCRVSVIHSEAGG